MKKLPYIPGEILKRSEIHDRFGGSRQSGISPTASSPYIFIFSGAKGEKHGYKDQWENSDVFSYTGEGQEGNMEFTRGNLALRNHLENGRRVLLFEYTRKSGYVTFVSELHLFDFDYFETHDRKGDLRIGIKFFFKRPGAKVDRHLDELTASLTIQRKDLFHPPTEDSEALYNYLRPNKTESEGLVKSRVGQGAYRKSILHRWEYRCAVTEFDDRRILIASHIVPWKDASDEQRLDVENGILLSPNYDALFDRHLITFDNQGKIILSNTIQDSAYQRIGVTGKESLRKQTDGMRSYLSQHQKTFQDTEYVI